MAKEIQVEEGSHSVFSPSGSERWLNCPGSIALEQKYQLQQAPSVYAQEGTAAHELARRCLIENVDARKYLGYKIMEFEVNHEMAGAVQEYLDYVLSFRTFNTKMIIEQTVRLDFLHQGMKGTADCIIEDTDAIHVIDYKHGKGVAVEPFSGNGPNTQLGTYAIGHLYSIYQRTKSLDHIKEVHLHIVQPRCPHPDGPIRSFKTSVQELQALSQFIRQQIADALSPNPTFNPGEKQCMWCPAAPVCRHLANYNLQIAQMEFSHLEKGGVSAPDPNVLEPREISLILKHSVTFEKWLKAVATFAMNALKAKKEIPEFKLVRKRSNRKFRNEEEAKNFLINELKIPEEQVYTKPKFKSPAQIEQVVGRKNKDLLKPFIVKPLGELTIAHISDKREAADPNDGAAVDFAAFKEEEDSEA